MLTLPPAVRVYVATAPIDCRKSFDGLSQAVMERMTLDPLAGHLYVFFNRRGNQVRILFWDRTGYCVVAKRLARGRFHFAVQVDAKAAHAEIEAAELTLILEGLDLGKAARRVRFRLPTKNVSAMQSAPCLS
jgi:transposase